MRSTKPSPPTSSPPTAADVPVTSSMLGMVRTEVLQRIDQGREEARADNLRLDGKIDVAKVELKAEIQQVKAELKAEIQEVKAELKAEIQEVKAEIHAVKAEIQEVKAEIHEVKADLHGMRAQMSRIEALVEEQNARNKVVLDGITALLSRQNQVEERVTQVEDTVRELAAARSPG